MNDKYIVLLNDGYYKDHQIIEGKEELENFLKEATREGYENECSIHYLGDKVDWEAKTDITVKIKN